MTRRRASVAATLIALSTLGVPSPPARATAPGTNGLVAFDATRGGNADVVVSLPDGSGRRRLTRRSPVGASLRGHLHRRIAAVPGALRPQRSGGGDTQESEGKREAAERDEKELPID